MPNTPLSTDDFEHLVEIFVPTVCRCRKPLPDARLTEVLDETKTKMAEWFGGGSVKVQRIEGFWGGEDGTTVEEPVYLVFSNTNATKLEGCREDVLGYVASMANLLTQEATALRIDGKMYQFPSMGDPKPHHCGGGSATARASSPRKADKTTRMRFLQASLQRVNSLSSVRDVFCNHLHYEFADGTMPTSRWPDALKQFLVPGTAPRVVADQNGFRIIYLQLADSCLRKGQERQLIQRLIKDDPALRGLVVVSDVDQTQWNLINVKFGREQESGKNKERMLLRRMRVGPGQPVRTAVERLIEVDVDLLGEDKDAAAIQDAHDKAFDVDAVTKQFFTEIAGWYFWALPQVEFPNDTKEPDEKVRATSLIRMLTRIIFCWFLREKKLVPANLFDQREVAKILNDLKPESCSYYQGVLQNLFFATLNQRMGKDKHGRAYRAFARDEGFEKNRSTYGVDTLYRYEEHFREPANALDLFADIPFLNGGLFECLDRTDEDSGAKIYIDGFSRNPRKSAKVPNDLFFSEERTVNLSEEFGDTRRRREKVRGLLRILHSYNFTIEENTPVDEEVALDPELLGKVFENLLASYNEETKKTARKQTGSFYTPRPIVDYMVDESLKAYLLRVLVDKEGMEEANAKDALDQLFSHDDEPRQFTEGQVATLITAIDEVKILDPACGSGAFPMGALHRLVDILGKLDPRNERWKQVQLAKLSSAEMREVLEASFADNDDDYGRKLYLIENCLYGVDIQPIAIQITKLRFFISLVCNQKTNRSKKDNHGIRPLPNLETKFVAANTLLGLPVIDQMALVDPRVNVIEAEIEFLYHSHFSNQRRDEKLRIQNKIKKLRTELGQVLAGSLGSSQKAEFLAKWDPFDSQASAEFFDPHWMFGRSLIEGFNIVIGNPPYIGESGNKSLFAKVKTGIMKPYYMGKMDYFYFFFHGALDYAKDGGVVAFITTNYWYTAQGALKLRIDLKQRSAIHCLINFNELSIFESALGQHNCITILKKGSSASHAKTCATDRTGLANAAVFDRIFSWSDSQTSYYTVPQELLFEGEKHYVRINREIESSGVATSGVSINTLLEEFREGSIPLGELAEINQGLVSGCDFVSSKNRQALANNGDYQIGDGIFVLDLANDRDACVYKTFNRSEQLLLKKFFKNSDIGSYKCSLESSKRVIYIDRAMTDISPYPNIQKHLARFGPLLRNRREVLNGTINQFQLQWPRTSDIFMGEKLVVPYRSETNSFAYNSTEWFCRSDCYVVTQPQKHVNLFFLLAFANSRLVYHWLFHRGKRKGRILELFQTPLSEIPIRMGSERWRRILELLARLRVLINTQTLGEDIAQLIDDLIDVCVMECYFFDHMAAKDLLFVDEVASHLENYDYQASYAKQRQFLDHFVCTVSANNSTVAKRSRRLCTDSPDVLGVIKGMGKV
jgi:hypothetical protein